MATNLLPVTRRNNLHVVSERGKEEKDMRDNHPIINALCRQCGCNQAQAAADARALGFEEEFASGIYTCCQVVHWADEQRLAWLNAAKQDGKIAEDVMRRLGLSEPAGEFVHLRSRRRQGL
ncbi:MAG: hypothetical protein JO033_23765 [Acidobacteriaceae bacterium]|nr:hypothetical protein [Acidobacteriaceae bacterium]MBV9502711.1 hypothetical protein [Acidobacteriaceae bacterium]